MICSVKPILREDFITARVQMEKYSLVVGLKGPDSKMN
jgi:hypothetical protein